MRDRFDVAGVTAAERVAVRLTLDGRDLRDVASDADMAAAYGRRPSHQTIANLLSRAGQKLGVRMSDAMAGALAAARLDRALAMRERAGRVLPGDMAHGDEVRTRRPSKRRTAADMLESLTDELLAEAAGGELSAERLQYFADAGARLQASGDGR